MKQTLYSNEKLLQYAASAVAFLALNEAGATVIYTDLDPDVTIGGEGAEIEYDINGDGDVDFLFSVTSISGVGTYYGFPFTYSVKGAAMAALNGNEILGSIVTYAGYSAVYAPVLEAGEGINGDDEFATGTASLGLSVVVSVYGFPYYSIVQGNWLDTEMKFIGFRMNVDTNKYYGWMRVSVSENASTITIHDYAYDDEANKSIFSGQFATDIIQHPLSTANVYSNSGNIYVNLSTDFTHSADVQVFDPIGKMVKEKNITTGMNILSCSDLPTGNYFVYLMDAGLKIKKQVHIQN